jgi:hypothetical protein
MTYPRSHRGWNIFAIVLLKNVLVGSNGVKSLLGKHTHRLEENINTDIWEMDWIYMTNNKLTPWN